jgi:hypothetical protein
MIVKQKLNPIHLTEFIKCKNSFEYFCVNYVLIEIPGGDAHLHPYKKQAELIRELNIYRYIICLKSRQIGISTIIQAYCAWLVVFFDNVVVGIISKDGREATDFARFIRGIVEKLPMWMKPKGGKGGGPGFDKYTEQSFILTNGSKVFSATVNPKAPTKTLRGKAITFLVIDEAAFIEYIDDAWTSMVPALSTSQKHARKAKIPYGTIILSTPNKTVGVGKWFYSKYTQAVSRSDEGHSIFRPFIIHWKQVSELAEDPDWYKTQCELFDFDERKINQELELKFLPAGGSFFDDKTCVVLQDCNVEPKKRFKLYNGELWIFAEPVKGKNYIIGVDTAAEHGEDNSAIVAWDYESLEQVADYQGKLAVKDFCKVVEYMCGNYPGLVVVENNSYGNQVAEHISSSPYNAMMYKETRGQTIIPGVCTNAKSRPLMIDALYSYISQYPQIVKSKRLALELIGLVSKPSGKVEADRGCRDDMALASTFSFYVRKYDPPLMMDSNRLNSSAFSSIANMNFDSKKMVFDFSDDEQEDLAELNARVRNLAKEIAVTPQKAFVDTFSIYRG